MSDQDFAEMTNRDRGNMAKRVLDAHYYSLNHNQLPSEPMPTQAISDLLVDLMHLAHNENIDFDECMGAAIEGYHEDLDGGNSYEIVELFKPGRLVCTPGASEVFTSLEIGQFIERHLRGDWGDLDQEDKFSNERAVRDGSRLLSAYETDDDRVYVITEADRSVTTVLLPEEY